LDCQSLCNVYSEQLPLDYQSNVAFAKAYNLHQMTIQQMLVVAGSHWKEREQQWQR